MPASAAMSSVMKRRMVAPIEMRAAVSYCSAPAISPWWITNETRPSPAIATRSS